MKKYATLLGAVLLGLVSVLSYAQAPVPFLNLPLIPDATAPGGPQFMLTVNGTGFVSKSVVNWNGVALATQFVSGSQLKAIVPAADIATAGTASVTVINPLPGGGTSNVVFFPVGADTGDSVGFGLVSSSNTGQYNTSVVASDFNGDGKLDLAVGTAVGRVFVFLGDGTGNFRLASSPYFGGGPLAVGDFNGDGKPDLAVSNGGTISILLGDGTGHFTLASRPETPNGSKALAVGDFNGDGKLDLAVVDSYSAAVSILLGDGAGNFTLASSPATGSGPDSIAVGDFNGDGKLDLVVANQTNPGTLTILLGDGMGNFTSAFAPVVGDYATSVAVGDFNGDGKLDLAVCSGSNGGWLAILLGDGTGNFTLASSHAGNNPESVAVGDFNGDGKLDLATANFSGTSVLLGDGSGNFTRVSYTATGGDAESLAVGDFNGDGKLDLVVASLNSRDVSVLLAAVPPVVLSTTNLDFGAQVVGSRSRFQPVKLTNIGTDTLNITLIEASGSFSQKNNCPSSLAPKGRCVINVAFGAHSRGTHTGAVTITDNAPTSPQTVLLTGVGTLVTLLPSSLRFPGGQRVGTHSKPQLVTFTNNGTRAVIIHSIHFVGRGRTDYAQTNTCGTAVPAGEKCTISVTFGPTSTGPKPATLNVSDNGGGSPQTVALSGFGTE
ncbi:MAG: FG-GAP-like repeat-containing protein [Terriglobales bacterium]